MRIGVSIVSAMHRQFRGLVLEDGEELETALPPGNAEPGQGFSELPHKGRIPGRSGRGYSADAPEDLSLDTVLSMGRVMMKTGGNSSARHV